MKSYLTGNPEIRLALNEDLSIGRGGRSIYGIALVYLLDMQYQIILICIPYVGFLMLTKKITAFIGYSFYETLVVF